MKGDVHHFVCPVKPVGKARPRFSVRKKKDGTTFNHVYSTQVTEEGQLLLFCLNKWGNKPPISGAMQIDFLFVFDRPKSHYGTGRNMNKLKHSSPCFHVVKPDFDNVVKILLDSLNGVIFKDDSYAVKGWYEKRYAELDETNRVELTITELE